MKKIGDIFLVALAVFNIPSTLALLSRSWYDTYENQIWWTSAILAVLVSATQLPISKPALISRLFRTLRHYIFRTKTIALILIIQLILTVIIVLIRREQTPIETVVISLCLNVLLINILILFGKISNSDPTQLLLHDPKDGKVYLFKNNKITHIPDPETMYCLGFHWRDVIYLNAGEIDKYNITTPITSIKVMRIIEHRGFVYGVVNDKLKHIPDMLTLNFIFNARGNTNKEQVNDIRGFKVDTPFFQWK